MSNIEYCLHQRNNAPLYAQIERLDPTQRFKVTVTPWKSKRSLEANKRYWALINGFGKHIGYNQDEMHEICRFKFLRNLIELEGEKIPVLQSTTKLNVSDFTDYMTAIERWAQSLGFFFQE